MATRLSQSTIRLDRPPAILGHASIVGKKEGEGPLAQEFDRVSEDTTFGETTWEKSESRLQSDAVNMLLGKTHTATSDVDVMFAGDLLNQCIGSTYGLRELDIPFLGLFGACSTMAEGLISASLFVEGGLASKAVAVTSSHFCTAERQFRFPLEYGGVRTPTSQWTVTGSGAVVLAKDGPGPHVTHITTGKVVDKGIKDANNMGAAMAPAAYATLTAHFQDTGRQPSFYDLIVTGDLGKLGKEILLDFFQRDGLELPNYDDCGVMIFDLKKQDVHCGGSGCGCSATVLTGYLLNGMREGKWQNILFCPTGALLSPTSTQQGESIPSICHAVAISMS